MQAGEDQHFAPAKGAIAWGMMKSLSLMKHGENASQGLDLGTA